MTLKITSITFSQDEIFKIKETILDEDKEEALKILKAIIKGLEENDDGARSFF